MMWSLYLLAALYASAHPINEVRDALTPNGNEIAIVQAYDYHEGEVDDVQDGQEWFAMMPAKEGRYTVRETTLHVTREDEMFGHHIRGDENALFYLRGLPLQDGQSIVQAIPSAINPDDAEPKHFYSYPVTVGPWDSVHFVADGQKIDVIGFGAHDYQPDDLPPERWDHGYALWVESGEIRTYLSEVMMLDESMPAIQWAGDLNGDHLPDFVIDVSGHYNTSELAVFLSKKRENGITYERVAERYGLGC